MIPHNRPTLGDEELQAAARVLGSGWLAQGVEVEAFENELCEFLGLPAGHAVALSSGTAALFMALWVLGAQGKRVAFPVYACSALRNAVAMAGGRELLLDVLAGSPNLDLDYAKRLAPDILIAPHIYGLPIDLSGVGEMQVIEDCAQCLGGTVAGLPIGRQSAVGVFSFYATKLITSGGQGGMLVSRDRPLADQARDYRDFDCRRDKKTRFNFQMTDLQAAIGRAQLNKLPEWLERRAHLFEIYKDAGLDMLDIPEASAKLEPVRYRAVIKTTSPASVLRVLAENEIRAIVPVEDWELLGEGSSYPNALDLARTTVSLPLYPTLTNGQAEKIASCIRGIA